MQLRVRVQVVDALDVADQHIPFGSVERVSRKGLRRRPVLVVVDEARVVVVLHEPSTEAVRPINEALGAQRRRRLVVDELEHTRGDDVNRLRRLQFIKLVRIQRRLGLQPDVVEGPRGVALGLVAFYDEVLRLLPIEGVEALDVAEAQLLRSITLAHGALVKRLGRDLDERLVDPPLLRFRVVAVSSDALRRPLLELVLGPAVGHLQQLARAGPDVLPELGAGRAALLRRARRRLRGVAAVLLDARGLAAQHGRWWCVCWHPVPEYLARCWPSFEFCGSRVSRSVASRRGCGRAQGSHCSF